MTNIEYDNKVFLAPMVRVGTLPFRLTALHYGAGTADPDLALKAALTVKEDVAGIDINCGCPKKFSIQGGMGAALLTNPDNLKQILTNLVQNVGLPVTCKIRLLDDKEKTIELVKMIESTGVKAITIHCRTKEQRSTTPAKWEDFKEIAQVVKNIPVAINGDVYSWQDIPRVKEMTNANSVMIARGAQYNPSAFRKEGLVPDEEAIKEYLKKCVQVNNVYQNTKYVLLTMATDPKFTRSETYRKIQKAKSALALCEVFGLGPYYHDIQMLQKSRLEEKEDKNSDTSIVTTINVGTKRKADDNKNDNCQEKEQEDNNITYHYDKSLEEKEEQPYF
ncbi:hypothetical protein INT45_007456 [Circinella minor]|uniref:DUS-like FMN-binding domain-containing protein n=1 Tax=Circinella minor TaxID=1195481 RepID=A0A8H7SFT1_9FUNG|nr:hypothetical protein INT45_007456 [Circinella minor]